MAGRPLLILTTKGAKSGEPREAVLTFTRDDGRYVVCATAGGSPTTPSWYHNLLSNPAVQVEAKGETFTATASVAPPGERERLWDQHVAERPGVRRVPGEVGPDDPGRHAPAHRLRRPPWRRCRSGWDCQSRRDRVSTRSPRRGQPKRSASTMSPRPTT